MIKVNHASTTEELSKDALKKIIRSEMKLGGHPELLNKIMGSSTPWHLLQSRLKKPLQQFDCLWLIDHYCTLEE